MHTKPTDISMKNLDYQHNIPQSFKAKVIQSGMRLIGLKKRLEKKMISNNFKNYPAKPSKSLLSSFNIQEIEQNGRKVWTIAPREGNTDIVILYLHGGAYMANITKQHWDIIKELINKTGATIVVPDYPLTPASSCKETYDFIEVLYTKMTAEYPSKRIICIGDSAGGGLAFGFVQQLRNNNKRQPDQIILFSPWLDVTMNNPGIELTDKADKILSIKGLRSAGQKYAGNLDLKDYRVSPIYGDLTGLCRISIFTGTNDILNPDAHKCKQLMKNQQVCYNYFEYPEMFHDWVIISSLEESRDVIDKVYNLVNDH